MKSTPDERPTLRAIIAALGPEWKALPVDYGECDDERDKTRMIASNGKLEFYIAAQMDWRDKPEPYKISPKYPRTADGSHQGSGKYLTINCGRMKAPAQVAKDITRRFLPEYEKLYNDVREYVRRNDHQEATRRAVEEMIAAALDVQLLNSPYGRREPRTITISPYESNAPYGKMNTGYYGDRISMELSNLDPETAIEIGRIVQQAARWKKAQQVKP